MTVIGALTVLVVLTLAVGVGALATELLQMAAGPIDSWLPDLEPLEEVAEEEP